MPNDGSKESSLDRSPCGIFMPHDLTGRPRTGAGLPRLAVPVMRRPIVVTEKKNIKDRQEKLEQARKLKGSRGLT